MSDHIPRVGANSQRSKIAHPLHLVACVSGKLAEPAAARDLYCSDWFAKARAYVEHLEAPWLILSAQFGLVGPKIVIPPYDLRLGSLNAAERRQWGDKVAQALRVLKPEGGEIVFLAGRTYRDAIISSPNFTGWHVSIPMEGLGIGLQKAWLHNQINPLIR